MKKQSVTIILLALMQQVFAQQPQTMQVFRDKKVNLNINNFYQLILDPDGSVHATTANKKGKGEIISFDQSLSLKKKEEMSFDIEKSIEEKNRNQFGETAKIIPNNGRPYAVLKEDLLFVSTKALGMSFQANQQKVGLKQAMNIALQKGRIIQYTYSWNYQSYGKGSNTVTEFQALEEAKLKSEEGKNMSCEIYKTNGEELSFSNTSQIQMSTYSSSQVIGDWQFSSPVGGRAIDNKKDSRNYIAGVNGDMLLVALRRPIIKFGKAPSAEDMLPKYLLMKVNANTLDITSQNSFQEPVSRAVIYRNQLSANGGVIIVSAPISVTGDKIQPKDPNVRNYVFRHITEDAKLNWTIEHEVPGGHTPFHQSYELKDGSIVLVAGTVVKKKVNDEYYNKNLNADVDGLYIMRIKDGKVMNTHTITAAKYAALYRSSGNTKSDWKYFPTEDLKGKQVQFLEDGTMLYYGNAEFTDPKTNQNKTNGSVCIAFAADGNIKNVYVAPSVTKLVPELDQLAFNPKNNTVQWLTFDYVDEESALMHPAFLTLDLSSQDIAKSTVVGDEKHAVTTKYPFMLTDNGSAIQFFGFDLKGNEFWTQKVQF